MSWLCLHTCLIGGLNWKNNEIIIRRRSNTVVFLQPHIIIIVIDSIVIIFFFLFNNMYYHHHQYTFRPRRFTLKSLKQYYFTCKDLTLRYYKSQEAATDDPIEIINLRGCEVTPDVILSQQRYGIKLEVPATDGMTDYILRCSSVSWYAL